MAQKDKVKELVGRGLDSYHTKSLQQMDRIEKKNKEQNHKISILTNELDNDYLTKTEEGSVVSLEHSKEGMVYLDELQGNTLVNYCTDGSKELTLNGDIDIEGTFVTTTEGVDNGLVDVMCEGNTLVNLVDLSKCTMYVSKLKMCSYTISEDLNWKEVGVSRRDVVEKLKPNTNYTVFMYIQENTVKNDSIFYMNMGASDRVFVTNPKIPTGYTGLIIRKLVTKEDFSGVTTALLPTIKDAKQGQKVTFKYMIIEGDLTNIENLEYFEGMKSVGQDDENGHKIEILSQNKNLYKKEDLFRAGYSFGVPIKSTGSIGDLAQFDNNRITIVTKNFFNVGIGGIIPIKKNKSYTISLQNTNIHYTDVETVGEIKILPLYANEVPVTSVTSDSIFINRVKNMNVSDGQELVKITFDNSDYDYIQYYIGGAWKSNASGTLTMSFENVQIEESDTVTSYVINSFNKKEILLNEPLRGLPNGVKDKKVKIGNKWYIERNCGEFTLTEFLEGITHNVGVGNQTSTMVFAIDRIINNLNYKKLVKNGVCDRFSNNTVVDVDKELIYFGQNINIRIDKTKLTSQDTEGFKQWLRNNPTKIVYQLETPIYEPLEIEPVLNTYNDIAHISNNSIIPCSMKIKNTGYNAIIKPSTLYTVALDTNKAGTIGVNLGGAKGTTNNNVLTLTTPATLSDDSLRLYGKGIKGSKVRLLEGDKTNWIPSYFEGMKSSFEDKVQDDGSYKMEILSNNKNLINVPNMSCIPPSSNGGWWNLEGNDNSMYNNIDNKTNLYFYAEKGKRYIISFDSKNLALTQRLKYQNQEMILPCSIISNENGRYKILVMGDGLFSTFRFRAKIEDGSTPMEVTNFMIIEENLYSNEFIKNKYNKIQFSSIEPLRGVGDVKDRFVFKDDKLMIERNCSEVILNGSEKYYHVKDNGNFYMFGTDLAIKGSSSILKLNCDKFVINGIDLSKNIRLGNSGNSIFIGIDSNSIITKDTIGFQQWLQSNNIKITYARLEPTYEEIPFELQKIILEGYENGTLFFDTNIPPTSTITYAGETPIVKSVKLNKTEVSNNTEDINDNIIPYLCDMDYRIVTLELQQEQPIQADFYKLFGGVYEMLKRDILSKRLSKSEYEYRLTDYFNVGKLTEQQVRELEDLINE